MDRKAAETASSPWLCLGSAAQYYRGAEAAVVVHDVASFVGGLILTCLIVHLQPLLVVVRLEHELEHTWFGFGFGFGLWFGFGFGLWFGFGFGLELEHTVGHNALGPLALVLLQAVSKYNRKLARGGVGGGVASRNYVARETNRVKTFY